MQRNGPVSARFLMAALVLVAVLGLANTVGVDAAPATVKLGTSTKGGGFELFGRTVAELITATDPALRVEALPSKGSKQNLTDLEQGAIDIGLVEGNAAREALDGIGRPAADLKVLSVMYPNPGMFVVRADSPYRRIEDLMDKPVAFGTRASGLRILANDVLDGLGLDPERDFQQVILEKAADGPKLVLNDEVEALWGAGIGWPGFVKVAESPGGARFIAPTREQIEQIRARHPHLKPMSVPAGTYQGQNQRIDSVGLWSLILARPSLSEPVAYALARALHRAQPELSERLSQGGYATAANTVEQVAPEQLHPGAARYYREIGLLP